VDNERRWARLRHASFVALVSTPLHAGPLAWGPTPAASPARPCPSASPAARPADLSLVWVDVMGVAPFAFPEGSREVLSLLDRMGVRATLRRGETRTVSADSELTVILLRDRPPGTKLHHTVMGATPRSPDGVRAIWVYADGVAASLGLERGPGVRWSPPMRREFAVALGRVVVHELVHAITPRRPHVNGGLMAERMGRSLLLSPRLRIDAGTSEAFRAALGGRPAADDAMAALPESSGAGPAARP
jgi:hypothetical protein